MPETKIQTRKRIVIVGGGIAGLAAANRVLELSSDFNIPPELFLLESSSNAGGVIRTHLRDGFLLEGGPDMFSVEKPEALSLAKRLGLSDQLVSTQPTNRRSFIVRHGRLVPVPEGFQLLAPSRLLPFLTSEVFSLKGKLRMGMDLILPRRDRGEYSDESLADFVRRRFGREALERMAQPMIGGIYTADPEKLSVSATIPRLLEMERRHRSIIFAMFKQRSVPGNNNSAASGARYGLFRSFGQGMQALADGIVGRLPPNTLRLNTRATALEWAAQEQRWNVHTSSHETLQADALCLALPAYASAALLANIQQKLADELKAISYASTATINVAYRRADIPHALNGFGFVIPFVEKRSMIACSFSSNKFAGRAPEGHVLLRCFVGGALQPDRFEMDDESMVQSVRWDLRQLLGIQGPPLFTQLQRWPQSMPQYHIGHEERVRNIEKLLESIPGLWIAGSALKGTGIPDCVRNGETAAEEMLAVPGRQNGQSQSER